VPRSIIDPHAARSFSPVKQMSKTEPLGTHNRVRASEPRMTSAATRALRDTKRDIEEMHSILQKKKRDALLSQSQSHPASGPGGSRPHSRLPPGSAPGPGADTHATGPAAAAASAPGSPTAGAGPPPSSGAGAGQRSASAGSPGKGRSKTPQICRPRTPDLLASNPDAGQLVSQQPLRAALILLQRLVRGRAVQNVMYEGRLRRAELIAELRSADDALAAEARQPKSAAELGLEARAQREENVRRSTVDAIGGLASSHLLNALALEKVRFARLCCLCLCLCLCLCMCMCACSAFTAHCAFLFDLLTLSPLPLPFPPGAHRDVRQHAGPGAGSQGGAPQGRGGRGGPAPARGAGLPDGRCASCRCR